MVTEHGSIIMHCLLLFKNTDTVSRMSTNCCAKHISWMRNLLLQTKKYNELFTAGCECVTSRGGLVNTKGLTALLRTVLVDLAGSPEFIRQCFPSCESNLSRAL